MRRTVLIILVVPLVVATSLAVGGCHRNKPALGPATAPFTAQTTNNFLELIPDLGWSDGGMIKRSVLTASSITFEGITFKSSGVSEARPRWHFGEYEYETRFKSAPYELWIYSYTDDPNADLLNVRSAYFKVIGAKKDSAELKIVDNLVLGKTRIEDVAELPNLGKPVESGPNYEGTAAIWKYEGLKKRFHSFRLQFNKSGVLSRITWISG